MEVFSFLASRRMDMGDPFENIDDTITVNLEQGFKQLKNVMDKQIRVWWDIMTLEKYKQAHITPRRLRWDLGPNDGLTEDGLTQAWYNFFNGCENKLLDIIIDRRKIKLNKIETTINSLKESMTTHISTDDYSTRAKKLQDFLSKLDTEIKNKKVKKYQRDKKDYLAGKIYSWQENDTIPNSNNTSLNDEIETTEIQSASTSQDKTAITSAKKKVGSATAKNVTHKPTPKKVQQGGPPLPPPPPQQYNYPPHNGQYSRPWRGGQRGRGRGYYGQNYGQNYGPPQWQGEWRDWGESFRPPMPVFQTGRGGWNQNPQEGEGVEGEAKRKRAG